MAEVMPSTPQIVDNVPVYLEAPAGMELLVFRPYPGYDSLVEGEIVNTAAIDFGTFLFITPQTVEAAVDAIVPHINGAGEELLAYGLFGGLTQDITLPNQICLGDWCVPVPFGGSTVATVNMYRLWILTRPYVAAGMRAQVRPFAWPLLLIIAQVLAPLLFLLWIKIMQNGSLPFTSRVSPLPTQKPAPSPTYPPAPPAGVTPPSGSATPTPGGGTPQPGGGTILPSQPIPWYVYGLGAVGIGAFVYLAASQSKGG